VTVVTLVTVVWCRIPILFQLGARFEVLQKTHDCAKSVSFLVSLQLKSFFGQVFGDLFVGERRVCDDTYLFLGLSITYAGIIFVRSLLSAS
jgi:hypothetical protein